MTPTLLHASCVACGGRGVLIVGPSGAGKSGLALKLIACGADLVSDDQTEIRADGNRLLARAPAALHGLIEARGLGILHLKAVQDAEIALVVDLGQTETERLPPHRDISYLGIGLALVFAVSHDHFPAAILCYLQGSRYA